LLLEQLLHQLFGGFRISLPLDEEVQNFAFIINGAPKPIRFASDDDHHFIEVPVIAGPGAAPTQIGSDGGSKLQEPASDSLVGKIQASFRKQILYIAETQRESRVEPHGMTNNFGRKAVTLERELAH
jgi:hypothetical protein